MALTVLNDAEIAGLLNGLTAEELELFRTDLTQALYEYSTGTQAVHAGLGDIQQPPRTAVTSPATAATTLFMPSCSTAGIGMKVITLSQATAPPPAAGAPPPTIRPTGALTLYAATGEPVGLLHASTLTAFRTALASACLLQRRETVRNLVVFGCGEQAYWHVRLALLLRGATVRHVHVVSRRFDGARAFVARFFRLPAAVKEREGWGARGGGAGTGAGGGGGGGPGDGPTAGAKFSILTTGYNDYGRLLAEHLRSADVVFCCTPATAPLFDPAILTSREGRRKGRLLVAVGSYTHQMRELPAELLRQATRAADHHAPHKHYHKHAVEGGVVVVDTLDGALKEAGEIADAGLTPRHLVELGELVMLARIQLQDEDSEDVDDDDDGTDAGSRARTVAADVERLSLAAASPSSSSLPALALVPPPPSPAAAAAPVPAMASVYRSDAAAEPAAAPRRSRSRPPSPSPSSPTSPAPSSPSRKGSGTSLLASLHPHHHHHHHHKRSASQASADGRKKKEAEAARWLQRGNVIYKSVGLGLMDLSVGLRLVSFARAKGVGTRIEGF